MDFLALSWNFQRVILWNELKVEDCNLELVTRFFRLALFVMVRLFILELSGKPNYAFGFISLVFNLQMLFNLPSELFCLIVTIVRPTRSETKWKVYCHYISFTVHCSQCTLRFRSFGTRLLFEIELSSKLHLVDPLKGFKLS